MIISKQNKTIIFKEYQLDENEERSMIEPKSYENPKLQELIRILLDWINDELHTERIIVQDVEEDLYDGQVVDYSLRLFCSFFFHTLILPFFMFSQRKNKNYIRKCCKLIKFSPNCLCGDSVSPIEIIMPLELLNC